MRLALHHDRLQFWKLLVSINNDGAFGLASNIHDLLATTVDIHSTTSPTKPHGRHIDPAAGANSGNPAVPLCPENLLDLLVIELKFF